MTVVKIPAFHFSHFYRMKHTYVLVTGVSQTHGLGPYKYVIKQISLFTLREIIGK